MMETKVVKILSEFAVVLGAGADQGIREGVEFVIFERGDQILDPETKESLGCLEIVKGRVQVTDTMPNMCIARTPRRTVTKTRRIPSVLDPLGIGPLAQIPFARTEEYEVDVSDRLVVESTDPDYAKRKVVRVGDRARTVL